MILDMAIQNSGKAIQLSDIAKRQEISLKYLEQIIIPLKKANYVSSIRGARGGYILEKKAQEISVGEIVALLEGGVDICECSENPKSCNKADSCLTRKIWIDAAKAMYEKLNSITFLDLIEKNINAGKGENQSCF